MILEFFRKFRWRYVGTVHGLTYYIKDGERTGSEDHGYWVLTENGFGSRRCKKVGDAGGSPAAIETSASVSAWLRGGPTPDLSPKMVPPPARKKPAKQIKSDGNVIKFPKGSA